MKQITTGILTVLFIASGFASLPSARAAEAKIAYVDVTKMFDEYQKTQDNDRTLQDAGRKKEEERDALVYDIRQLKDELVLLSGDMKDKKQELLEEKIKSLQDFDRQAKNSLSEKRNEAVRDIFKDIDAAIQRYGERKGVDFIFNEKALLYKNESSDVTQEVLQELNQNYKGKK